MRWSVAGLPVEMGGAGILALPAAMLNALGVLLPSPAWTTCRPGRLITWTPSGLDTAVVAYVPVKRELTRASDLVHIAVRPRREDVHGGVQAVSHLVELY